MAETINVDKVMDLKGLPCPMPVVKVSKGIKDIQVGQVIEALITDRGRWRIFRPGPGPAAMRS